MSGPRKFLPRGSWHVMVALAVILAVHLGAGRQSSTLLWFGALGWVALAIVAQSEWPREPDGSFVAPEELHRHPPPEVGPIARLFNHLTYYAILAAVPLGLLAKCTNH